MLFKLIFFIILSIIYIIFYGKPTPPKQDKVKFTIPDRCWQLWNNAGHADCIRAVPLAWKKVHQSRRVLPVTLRMINARGNLSNSMFQVTVQPEAQGSLLTGPCSWLHTLKFISFHIPSKWTGEVEVGAVDGSVQTTFRTFIKKSRVLEIISCYM